MARLTLAGGKHTERNERETAPVLLVAQGAPGIDWYGAAQVGRTASNVTKMTATGAIGTLRTGNTFTMVMPKSCSTNVTSPGTGNTREPIPGPTQPPPSRRPPLSESSAAVGSSASSSDRPPTTRAGHGDSLLVPARQLRGEPASDAEAERTEQCSGGRHRGSWMPVRGVMLVAWPAGRVEQVASRDEGWRRGRVLFLLSFRQAKLISSAETGSGNVCACGALGGRPGDGTGPAGAAGHDVTQTGNP